MKYNWENTHLALYRWIPTEISLSLVHFSIFIITWMKCYKGTYENVAEHTGITLQGS